MSYHVQKPSQQAATPASVSVWVTDVVCMLNVGVLAVACTPGFIAFYNAAAMRIIHPIIVVHKLQSCPSSVDYWSVVVSCLVISVHMSVQQTWVNYDCNCNSVVINYS